MKKKLLLLVAVFSFGYFHAQQNYYENVFLELTGIDLSLPSGDVDYANITANTVDQSAFYWTISARMEALLVMYESTGNVQYLHTFVKIAFKALNRRDDNRTMISLPAITTYHDISTANPTWSTRRYNKLCPRYDGHGGDENWHRSYWNFSVFHESICIPIPHLVGNANVIYSFVKFYNIVNNDASIQGIMGDTELLDDTFEVLADQLLAAAKETFNYFDRTWDTTAGAYRQHAEDTGDLTVPLEFKDARLPLNMQAAMGRVLVQLYAANDVDQATYADRLEKLSDHIKNYTNLVGDTKQWTYWGYQDPLPDAFDIDPTDPEAENMARSSNPLREDISHSALTVAFPLECFNAGIQNVAATELIYNATDIEEYANTFLNDIYIDVLQLHDGVRNNDVPGVNTNNTWNFKDNSNTHPLESGGVPDTTAPGGYLYSYWMMYAQQDARIHQMLNDFNTTNFYPILGSTDNFSGNLNTSLTIAQLRANQNLFAPIASEHTLESSSNWKGVIGGNFDTDATEEFVYVRELDGTFEVGEINAAHEINSIAASTSYGTNFQWANIAAGNFDNDAEDEIIAVSNEPGQIGYYIFDVAGTSINETVASTGWGPASDWVGAAAGNLIVGNKEEFVLARNFNLQLLPYTFDIAGNPVAGPITTLTTFGIPATAEIVGVAAGDVVQNIQGDELVVLVNSTDSASNGYYIFTLNPNTQLFTLVTQNTGWGTGQNWQALTLGDYDGDGKDNIIMHSDLTSTYRVYFVDETGTFYTIGALGSETFHQTQIQGNILGSGNFDASSTNDELIALRNTDGGIIVYTYNDQMLVSTRAANAEAEAFIENPNETSDEIKIYPNPTKGNLTINVTNDIANIQINNLLGETIKTQIQKNTVDLSSLAKGVYILTVELTNGKIITKKIIKN